MERELGWVSFNCYSVERLYGTSIASSYVVGVRIANRDGAAFTALADSTPHGPGGLPHGDVTMDWAI